MSLIRCALALGPLLLLGCSGADTPQDADPATSASGGEAAGAGSSGAMEGSGGTPDGAGAGGTGATGARGTGASTSTGGATGTGGMVAASGGALIDPCAGLILCEDFEGTALDGDLWAAETSGENTMTITSDQAAHGGQSLHVSVNNGYARLRNESVFPMPNNDYFGRMYVRVARFSTVDWAHWTMAEGRGTGDGSLIRVGGQYNTSQGKNRWGIGSDGGPTGDWTNHDDDPDGNPIEPPENEWVCLEWEHKGSTNETRFFVDGTEHPSLYTSASDHGGNQVPYVLPEMTSFWFGWWQYQQDPTPFELWLDLLAIDSERIGCLP